MRLWGLLGAWSSPSWCEAFRAHLQGVAGELGLSTASTWRDPAGLDSAGAVCGGNWSTARDLARLGRAALDDEHGRRSCGR